MEIINKFAPRTEFTDYNDFKNNFIINIPEHFDFAKDVVDVWAKAEPDKLALIYCNSDNSERFFTFSDISELSKRAATWFLKMGVKKGDRIFTLLRRRWEFWIISVALIRIGAVIVPSFIQMTSKDIEYMVNVSNSKFIIALNDDCVLSQIEGLKEKCYSLVDIAVLNANDELKYKNFNNFISCEPYEENNLFNNTDEMVCYFTSGTSGYPKITVHNRIYPLAHIVTAKYMQCVQNNGLHLTQTDSGWGKFGWGNIYGQWICGSAVLGYDTKHFRTHEMMNIMLKYKPTSICIPPTMYRFLLKDGLELKHVESCKWFSTAGEPLSNEVNERFFELTGNYIHQGFGQSECALITCSFQWLDIRANAMGKTSPLYDVHLIHPDNTECKVGEKGEIVIYVDKNNINCGLLEYYCIDGKNINPIVDGIYHTGDSAYMDKDGYYWYVGRIDDIIKSSGYRIGPFEIESVLNSHPAIKESAVVGMPDSMRGQIVCAAVVLCNGYESSDNLTKELQEYVKINTAPYKYPREIVYVKELPKTINGKIVRAQVKKIIE